MQITFLEASKKYNIPRSTVYLIFKKLENEDPEKYKKLVHFVQNRQVLDNDGIDYLLKERGLSLSNPVQDRQILDNSSPTEVGPIDLIEILQNQLELKNRDYDRLYDDNLILIREMQKSNDQLYELAKNQQVLQRELQYYRQLEFNSKTDLDIDKTTFRQEKTDLDMSDLQAINESKLQQEISKSDIENKKLKNRINELEQQITLESPDDEVYNKEIVEEKKMDEINLELKEEQPTKWWQFWK